MEHNRQFSTGPPATPTGDTFQKFQDPGTSRRYFANRRWLHTGERDRL